MTKYKAAFRVSIEVKFEDNGEDSLRDQAFEAAEDMLRAGVDEPEIELIGSSLKECIRS